MPSRSKSSSRLATITWRSIALRTLPSWSRMRAASSNSSCAAASFMRCFEPLQHRVVLAVEEVDELRDELVVLLVVDGVDARRRALLDVRVQARPPESVVPVELGLRAGPDRERAQQEVERLADGVRVRVRAEVADALALLRAQHHRARPLFVERDREVRVRLVVLQADVEAGPVLLDEVELEEERLDLVRGHDPLDPFRRLHHLPRALRQQVRLEEVVRQPAAEALRLPDIDHPTFGVEELIRAGRVGDAAGLGAGDHASIVAGSDGRIGPVGDDIDKKVEAGVEASLEAAWPGRHRGRRPLRPLPPRPRPPDRRHHRLRLHERRRPRSPGHRRRRGRHAARHPPVFTGAPRGCSWRSR